MALQAVQPKMKAIQVTYTHLHTKTNTQHTRTRTHTQTHDKRGMLNTKICINTSAIQSRLNTHSLCKSRHWFLSTSFPGCAFISHLLFRSLSSTQTHTSDFYRYLQCGSVHGSLVKIHVYVNAHTCTHVYTQYMYIYIWIYMYTYIFSKMNKKRQSNVHRKNRNISLTHTNTHITGEVCEWSSKDKRDDRAIV